MFTNDSALTTSEILKNPNDVFLAALTTIFLEGLGDKTFFISAFMSMKYNRFWFFYGAASALFIILGISAGFGHIVPTLVPEHYIKNGITLLFFFFGFSLLYHAIRYNQTKGEVSEEVEKTLSMMRKKDDDLGNSSDSDEVNSNETSDEIETDKKTPNSSVVKKTKTSSDASPEKSPKVKSNKFVFTQAFSLIFLGEWGDRSQIYTIALAAEAPVVPVFLGAFLGHCLVILLALVGGKYIAKKIPERACLFLGAVLYLCLGVTKVIGL